MTDEEIDILLEVIGVKPHSLWGTRPHTKLAMLKGSQYVDRNGELTDHGRLEVRNWRSAKEQADRDLEEKARRSREAKRAGEIEG